MSDQWYYRLFGQEYGPIPFVELQGLAESGTIQALDSVRCMRSGDWVAAATIGELGLSTSERNRPLEFATSVSEFKIADSSVATPRSEPEVADSSFATSLAEFEIAESSGTVSNLDFETLESQSAAEEWFCLIDGNELGPLDFEELINFAEREQIAADDQVKLGSAGKWRRVGSIGRLMAALPFQSVQKKIVPGSKPSLDTVTGEGQTPREIGTSSAVPGPAPGPLVAGPDPDATYRLAYEQAKAKVMESMLAQADAAFKAAETQAQTQVAWATAPHVDRHWWGWAGGIEFGPVEFAQVYGLAKTGQLKPSDFVRNGQHGQFVPSSAVPGLFRAVELIAKATEARMLAKAQADAAAAIAAPPATIPTTLLKPADPALAAAQTVKSNPVIPIPAAKSKSNPVMETARPAPRTITDPYDSAMGSDPESERSSERAGMNSPARSRNYGTPSNGGGTESMHGFSSSSSPSMSSYGYGASKPASFKPPVRKSSAPSSTWLSDTLEGLKEPKIVGSVCALAVVFLFFGWGYLPKSRGADIKRYQTLKGLVDEIRLKRTSAPTELPALQQKLEKAAKEIVAEVKDKASREEPAKQCLLWAARDEIPRVVQAGLAAESPAEQALANRLKDAAYELGLEKRPPVVVTQTATENNDG